MVTVGRIFRDFVSPVLILILGGLTAYDHFVAPPTPPALSPAVNGKALGHKFATSLAASFGDAWLAGANILEQGKSVSDAQVALQTCWQAERTQTFGTMVMPEFSKVLPEGTEPATSMQRADVVKLWRDFASGLKGGR